MSRRFPLRRSYCPKCGGEFSYRAKEKAAYCQSCGGPL